jgi:DNA helicase-2/ATP-dependent DNA helicase PcrA
MAGIPDPQDLQKTGRPFGNIHKRVNEPESVNSFKGKNLVKIPGSGNSESVSEATGENGILTPGARVEHPRFGKGRIENMEGVMPNLKATVIFDNFGKKQLLLKFAKLKVID